MGRREPSLFQRLFRGFRAGALCAAAIGTLEGSLVMVQRQIGLNDPGSELGRVLLYYLAVGGLLGAVVHGLLLRRHPRRAYAWTAALLSALVMILWCGHGGVFGNQPSTAVYWAGIGGSVLIALGLRVLVLRLLSWPRFASAVAVLIVAGSFGNGEIAALAAGRIQADLEVSHYTGEKPPNIVVLLIDTLRADRLSCYGYSRPTSPEIDKLAAAGTRFAYTWSQDSWTRPSVASLMTSLYPSSHDVRTAADVLPRSLPTLAQMLKARGYTTAGFSANPQVSRVYGFDQGFDVFHDPGSYLLRSTAVGRLEHTAKRFFFMSVMPLIEGPRTAQPKKVETASPQHAVPAILKDTQAGAVNRLVYDWLDSHDRDRPFFLYIQYLDPHSPYAPPVDLINEGGQPPVSLSWEELSRERLPYPLGEAPSFSPETMRGLSRLYDAEIRYVDSEIGKLIDQLRKHHMLDDTYIVVTADHGEELYDHKQWFHGQSLFDELLHVPLIVVGPGVRSQVSRAPAELIDILPTAAHWAGIDPRFPVQGHDLGPILLGGPGDPQRVLYSENPKQPFFQAIRKGGDKLIQIQVQDKTIWLQYDLKTDPGEKENLAAPNGPSSALRALLEETRKGAASELRERAGRTSASDEMIGALNALGYAGDEEE